MIGNVKITGFICRISQNIAVIFTRPLPSDAEATTLEAKIYEIEAKTHEAEAMLFTRLRWKINIQEVTKLLSKKDHV